MTASNKFISGWWLSILTLCFLPYAALDSTTAGSEKKKKFTYIIVPIIYVEPETGFGIGGNASCYYTLKGASNPSMLNLEISGTQHKQFIGTFDAEFYPGRLKWYASLASKTQRYPDLFYGIGNATPQTAKEGFTQHLADLTITGQRFVVPRLRLGGSVWLRHDGLSDERPDGLLASKAIMGSDPYAFFALGPRCTYDSRNSIYSTRSGWYADAQLLGALSGFLSDHSFGKFKLDGRYFHPVGKNQTFGLQTVAVASGGGMPFQLLPGIGEVLRGYAENRYRDRTMIALQAEYSFTIWRKLRGAVFGGFGEVFRRADDLSPQRLKVAAGGGLRYVFTDDGVSIRVDYGMSRHDGGQLYITAKDAF